MPEQEKTERNREIVRRYVDNEESIIELGRDYGVTHQRISQILQRAGVETRPPANLYHMHDEIAEAVQEPGATIQSTAKKLGVGRLIVSRVVNERELETGADRDRRERNAEIVHLYRDVGLTQREIGNMFGLTQAAISEIVNNHG